MTPAIRNGAGGGIFANGSRFYVSQGISDVSHADTFSYSLSDKGWFLGGCENLHKNYMGGGGFPWMDSDLFACLQTYQLMM